MSRKTHEELNALCIKYNVDRLWSWSRYHKYDISPFEYFLSYISPLKPDREDSIYGASGGFAHDILEKYYSKEIKYEDMISEFEDAWVTLGIADLKFDRCNEEKNEKIKENYLSNLRHFFTTHKIIKSKVDLERFIIIKVGKYIFQGYIDMTRKDEDGCFIIQDWKTSSIYAGEKIIKEAGQLILYAEGLIQLGIPLEKIKLCWNFLKYCNITTHLANGKVNIRKIERCKIGEELKSNCSMWLKKLGYENEVDSNIELLIQTNNIECLPKEVQKKYNINDCYVFVDLTQDVINNLKAEIIDTLDTIVDNEAKFKITNDEKLFWDTPENVEKQSYYFANLCGWSASLHKPYEEYIKLLKEKKECNNNVFNGVGISSDNTDDLSWLNDI